jgi:Tol biopolymer transport system component
MSYQRRILLACLALALLTGLLVWRGFQEGDVRLVARAPEGQAAPASATVRLSFSRPVDRLSVEERFRIAPQVDGRFFWDETTLVFRPARQLAPATDYTITLAAGLRDARGRANAEELAWGFRTRPTQLLALREGQGGGELWLVQPDGSGARLLHSEPEPISAFALAPDGSRAVYVVARGPQRSALVLLNLADGTTQPLVDDPAISATAPSWTSTDDLILFERRALVGDALSAPRVWLTQPDATQLGPLIGDAATIGYAPAWSPDGYKVAMIDGASQAITVYDFFSDQLRTLPDSSSEPVSWLPDSGGFVYSSVELGAAGPALRLRRSSLDGAEIADLTEGGAAELGPAVSPDGGQVAYSRRDLDSTGSTIWLVPSGGGATLQLSSPGPYRDLLPAWSPDSRQIAFVRQSLENPRERSAWVAPASGGSPTLALADVIQVGWAP